MEKRIKILFFLLVFKSLNSQENSLSLSVTKIVRWHFFNVNNQLKLKNNLAIQVGLGLNVSQIFNESYFKTRIYIYPYPRKFIQNFCVNYGIKRYINLSSFDTKIYFSYNHSLSKTPYIYKTNFTYNNEVYSVVSISQPKFTLIHNINIGLETPVSQQINFFTNIGLGQTLFWYNRNNIVKLLVELGFRYSFSSKSDTSKNKQE